jgi:selenophosphate synthetase-related protein
VSDLMALAHALRDLPGVRAKADIGLVAEVFGDGDWYAGPGDDGAVLPSGPGQVVVGGEAILPAFVAADPYGAGVAAVLANVNDLAAMGARPLALLDTIVGSADLAREALRGMHWAAGLYDVPVVGGHLTRTDGPPALSAFGVGRADRVLSACNAAAGQALVLGCCLEGSMRADFPFFPSFDERGARLAGDVRLLADLATSGVAVAAKDVSMAGLVGSLAMLLEPGRLGVAVDLDVLPVPEGVTLAAWLGCFPCYAFLLTSPAAELDACLAGFRDRGLTAQCLGVLDDSGQVRLVRGGDSAVVFDLRTEGVTNLRL